jgi:hypothetical protein
MVTVTLLRQPTAYQRDFDIEVHAAPDSTARITGPGVPELVKDLQSAEGGWRLVRFELTYPGGVLRNCATNGPRDDRSIPILFAPEP